MVGEAVFGAGEEVYAVNLKLLWKVSLINKEKNKI